MVLVVDDLGHPGTLAIEGRPERGDLALGSVTTVAVLVRVVLDGGGRVVSARSTTVVVMRVGKHHGSRGEEIFLAERLAEELVEERVGPIDVVEQAREEGSEAELRHLRWVFKWSKRLNKSSLAKKGLVTNGYERV
jgi:hypothetical protein